MLRTSGITMPSFAALPRMRSEADMRSTISCRRELSRSSADVRTTALPIPAFSLSMPT